MIPQNLGSAKINGRGRGYAVLCVGSGNQLKIPVLNKADVSVDLHEGAPIGTVTVLSDLNVITDHFMQEDGLAKYLRVSVVSPTDLSMERQQRLRSALTISSALTDEQSDKLMQCAVEHHDVFALEEGEVGEVRDVEHQIHTGDHPPIHQLPRQVPFTVREEMSRMVQEMLKDGVIQQSASPWASPVVLVRKKDGTLRFCVITDG